MLPASAGFLQQLRESTAVLHKQLEATPVSIALLSDTVTQQQYVDYLLKMNEVMAFYEKEILPVTAAVVPHIEQRKKQHLLLQDLNYFAIQPKHPEVVTYHPALPEKIGLAFALGYMYVIEGSTLGGRVILKHVSKYINVSENAGASFFNGYGADTGVYWKDFLQILTDAATGEAEAAAIIEGAKQAFQSIYDHFQQPI